MGKKKRFTPKNFESKSKSCDVSANIYMSMLMSYAWQDLTSRQKSLYLCCKAQYYSLSNNKTGFDEEFRNNRDYFVFPQHLWFKNSKKAKTPDGSAKNYNLYGNKRSFYYDMGVLIDHGFIDCVKCGADLRKKTLYRFSDRWHDFGEPGYVVPEDVKTIAMANTRKTVKPEPGKRNGEIQENSLDFSSNYMGE